MPNCGGAPEDIWFNYEVQLKGIPEGCDDQDRFVMGALISNLVLEVQCSLLEFKQEIFESELCQTPVLFSSKPVVQEGLRFLLAANESHQTQRRLATYYYSGGGRCRRCRSRRRLRSLKEVTVEGACGLASEAELGADLAASALEQATFTHDEIVGLAASSMTLRKVKK